MEKRVSRTMNYPPPPPPPPASAKRSSKDAGYCIGYCFGDSGCWWSLLFDYTSIK